MLSIDADYGHSTPLGHLEKDFAPGHVYGLAGPNGSGKSTLLATLGGELAPLDGSVECDGHPVGTKEQPGAVITVAEPVFLPDLTVGEHLDLMGKAAGVDVAKLCELWALERLLPHPASRLSSGQRQRVFLAAQLYQPARALLIDEPERHLDAAWTEFLASELRYLADEENRCIVVASHSDTITQACDEVVQL